MEDIDHLCRRLRVEDDGPDVGSATADSVIQQVDHTRTVDQVNLSEQADNDNAAESRSAAATPIKSTLPTGNPKFARIVDSFIERLPQQLVEMQKAIDCQDFEAVSSLAHWLKGAGGNVGFGVFTESAGNLEQMALNEDGSGLQDAMNEIVDYASRLQTSTGDGADFQQSA